MQLTRTTVRLQEPLWKMARSQTIEMNISFQTLLSRALESYLKQNAKEKAQKLIFDSRDLGAPLDNLTREDIYAD